METAVLDHLPYFWAAVGVLFLVVEVASGTFYGLAVALAAFVTATFVLATRTDAWTMPQFLVFFGASLVLCVALPNLLAHKVHSRQDSQDQKVNSKLDHKPLLLNSKPASPGLLVQYKQEGLNKWVSLGLLLRSHPHNQGLEDLSNKHLDNSKQVSLTLKSVAT